MRTGLIRNGMNVDGTCRKRLCGEKKKIDRELVSFLCISDENWQQGRAWDQSSGEAEEIQNKLNDDCFLPRR